MGVILFIIGYFWISKSKKNNAMPDYVFDSKNFENDFSAVYDLVKNTGAFKLLPDVERIFRLETAHMSSKQYRLTGSPGMLAFSSTFPFGWPSLKSFAELNTLSPSMFNIANVKTKEGKEYRYVKFPSVRSAILFVIFVLLKRGGNPGSWNSNDATQQMKYKAALGAIIPRTFNRINKT